MVKKNLTPRRQTFVKSEYFSAFIRSKTLIIIGLIFVSLAGWFLFLPSEKDKIKKCVNRVAELVSKEAKETPVALALKINSLQKSLAKSVTILIPERQFASPLLREELLRRIVGGLSNLSSLTVTIHDINITMPQDDQAVLICTSRLSGLSKQQEQIKETHEVEFTLNKSEDNWLINKIKLPIILQR